MQRELQRREPRLFFGLLTLVNEWAAWALDTALCRGEGSFGRRHPLLARLFRPLGEMLDQWGAGAKFAVGDLRFSYLRRLECGDLPQDMDPAWLVGGTPVAQAIAEKLENARSDPEGTETVLKLFGLKKKGRGPKIDVDRHLYCRIMYVRQREEFKSDRRFFLALAKHLASLPPPHARRQADIATWTRDMMTKDFKSGVVPLVAARSVLRGTTPLTVLLRVSPERPGSGIEGAKQ